MDLHDAQLLALPTLARLRPALPGFFHGHTLLHHETLASLRLLQSPTPTPTPTTDAFPDALSLELESVSMGGGSGPVRISTAAQHFSKGGVGAWQLLLLPPYLLLCHAREEATRGESGRRSFSCKKEKEKEQEAGSGSGSGSGSRADLLHVELVFALQVAR